MGKIRDITFDIAKGIGIVLVVIGHYIPDNAPSWYIGFVSFVYHFHMPLFFMIAGFFYERSYKKDRLLAVGTLEVRAIDVSLFYSFLGDYRD